MTTSRDGKPRWRVGLYGKEVIRDGLFAGTMATPELAAQVVEAMNAREAALAVPYEPEVCKAPAPPAAPANDEPPLTTPTSPETIAAVGWMTRSLPRPPASPAVPTEPPRPWVCDFCGGPEEPGAVGGPFWACEACVRKHPELRPIDPHAPTVPMCRPWCGTEAPDGEEFCNDFASGPPSKDYCSELCCQAKRPLNPAPPTGPGKEER